MVLGEGAGPCQPVASARMVLAVPVSESLRCRRGGRAGPRPAVAHRNNSAVRHSSRCLPARHADQFTIPPCPPGLTPDARKTQGITGSNREVRARAITTRPSKKEALKLVQVRIHNARPGTSLDAAGTKIVDSASPSADTAGYRAFRAVCVALVGWEQCASCQALVRVAEGRM